MKNRGQIVANPAVVNRYAAEYPAAGGHGRGLTIDRYTYTTHHFDGSRHMGQILTDMAAGGKELRIFRKRDER